MIAAAIRRRLVLARVTGHSMSPTFADGQVVRAVRRRRYRVGDVVVFETGPAGGGGPRWRIKRVAAVAGDPAPAWLAAGARVPAGCVVVQGDNPVSQDSRQLGYITLDRVRGRVRG